MKKVACFCIPAYGHTNPMLPVVMELVKRGNTVRFYSFNEFGEKIKATGAEFVSCDAYLPELSEREEAGLKNVSITEMTVQDIRIALRMDDFLDEEFNAFKPDVVFTDSVCFWGKLNAWKRRVPTVVSTCTFAFNQLSSRYIKHTLKESADMIFGLPRILKELDKLKSHGYRVKGVLSLVLSDNQTDSIVYTSAQFQPYAESFSARYAFVGPSLFSNAVPDKKKERPLVYVSMGTVVNDRPDFYAKCIEALRDRNVDVVISCGRAIDLGSLGELPDNIQAYPYVDQLDVLSRADVFITHCGMNSVSESLYMATPMVLYPQTGEQKAVARRVMEFGAGKMLNDDSVDGVRASVYEILSNSAYRKAAEARSADFRSCVGASGAADFIENAPHSSNGIDVIDELNKTAVRFQFVYWAIIVAAISLIGFLITWKFVWNIGVAAGALSNPFGRAMQKRKYASILRKIR